MSKTIHLGVIEDESFMLESIRETFINTPGIEITLEARTMEDALDIIQNELQLNTLLLDINLPGMNGLEGIRYLKEKRPSMDIIMLTNKDDSDNIFKALCAGAVSYISKKKASPPVLREAVYTVSRGESYMSPGIARKVVQHFAPPKKNKDKPVLTPRQHQIVELLTEGLSYKLIADKLLISVETVRDHIKKIYKTLQVNSKAEVIIKKLGGEI